MKIVLEKVVIDGDHARRILNLAGRDDLERLVGGDATYLIRNVAAHEEMRAAFPDFYEPLKG